MSPITSASSVLGRAGLLSTPSVASHSPTSSIADRSLSAPLGEVNLDAYLVLFSSLVSYCHNRVTTVDDLEKKLAEVGYRLGCRYLELYCVREKQTKRQNRLINMLSFVYSTLWKFIFGKEADSLKKVSDSESKYYIEEARPIVNKYISVPKDFGHLNCAAFIAGIVNGVLDSAGFPADVKAFSKEVDGQKGQPRTIYYITFSQDVMERGKRLR